MCTAGGHFSLATKWLSLHFFSQNSKQRMSKKEARKKKKEMVT